MNRGKKELDTGSLDMLLDTMCNTFGGVCFIALMVAILTAMNPKSGGEAAEVEVDAKRLVDREKNNLTRRCDELKSAIEIQKSFLATNQATVTISVVELTQRLSSNATAIARLESQRKELDDILAALKTDADYSKREAARLERLLKELEERLGKPIGKQRSVRTPTEREVPGLRCVDCWLRKGRLYLLSNPRQCERKEIRGASGTQRHDYFIISGSGYRVDETFFNGHDWQYLKNNLGSQSYLRIYSDKESFPQLCELRDALIHDHKQYNWHIRENEVLSFVKGYDGRIQ